MLDGGDQSIVLLLRDMISQMAVVLRIVEEEVGHSLEGANAFEPCSGGACAIPQELGEDADGSGNVCEKL
jgi:hypothetical protein